MSVNYGLGWLGGFVVLYCTGCYLLGLCLGWLFVVGVDRDGFALPECICLVLLGDVWYYIGRFLE